MGTQINMPISSSDNLIGSLQFHNRFYNYFNNTPHTYTIPIIYNTVDSSQNYINDFSVNQRNDNVDNQDIDNQDMDNQDMDNQDNQDMDNQDMDNQDMDNLNRNIMNGIDALTNIISDIRNTNVSNRSISSLEELNSYLTVILRENNYRSSNLYTTMRRNYNDLQIRANNLQIRVDTLERQADDFRESATQDELCCICNEEPRTFVNTSCGHMCSCQNCTSRLDVCPICRAEGTFIRIIRS